jgi:hypothetical protein
MLKNIFSLVNIFILNKDKLILMVLALVQVLISFASIYLIVKKIGFTDELDIFLSSYGSF